MSKKELIMFSNPENGKLDALNPGLFKMFLEDMGQGTKLIVTIEKYSKDTNQPQLAVFHILVNQINDVTGQGKQSIKDYLKGEYGVKDLESGKLKSCAKYTQKEMGHLIEMTTIFMHQQLGIKVQPR